MAERRSRGSVAVAGVVLVLLGAGALVLAWQTGSWDVQPVSPSPIRVVGLPPTRLEVGLDVVVRSRATAAVAADLTTASVLSGLSHCAVNPPDYSSVPELPGFTCSAAPTFDEASMTALEQLPSVESIDGSNARQQHELLYLLGVVSGDPALIVQPTGSGSSRFEDLAALEQMPGVLHCGLGRGGPFLGYEIACDLSSHAAAVAAQGAARGLGVAYAEVLTW